MTDIKNAAGELGSEYDFDADEAMRELEKLERESRTAAADFEDYPVPKGNIAALWVHDVAGMGLNALAEWTRRPHLSPGEIAQEVDKATRETAAYRQRLWDARHTYAGELHEVMRHNWSVPDWGRYWLTEGMRDSAVAFLRAVPAPETASEGTTSSGVALRFSLGLGAVGLTAGFALIGPGGGDDPSAFFFIGPRVGPQLEVALSAEITSIWLRPEDIHEKWGGGVFLGGAVGIGVSYANMRAPTYGDIMADFYGLNVGAGAGIGASYNKFFKL